MRRKTIILGNENVKQMTFEEVVSDVEENLKFEIRKIRRKLPQGNLLLNEEDLMQEVMIGVWEAYEEYDSNYNTAFFTFMMYKVRGVLSNLIEYHCRDMRAEIPTSIDQKVNTGQLNDDGTETSLKDFLEDDTICVEGQVVGDVMLKDLVDFAEGKEMLSALECILTNGNISEYARREGISRQAGHARISKLRKELQQMIL